MGSTDGHDSLSVVQYCVICDDETGNEDQVLSNGSTYHQSCYQEILQEIERLQEQIIRLQEATTHLNTRMRNERSLMARIGRFLSGDESKVDHLRAQIIQLQAEVQEAGKREGRVVRVSEGLI